MSDPKRKRAAPAGSAKDVIPSNIPPPMVTTAYRGTPEFPFVPPPPKVKPDAKT
jgi:hypothetical protein